MRPDLEFDLSDWRSEFLFQNPEAVCVNPVCNTLVPFGRSEFLFQNPEAGSWRPAWSSQFWRSEFLFQNPEADRPNVLQV